MGRPFFLLLFVAICNFGFVSGLCPASAAEADSLYARGWYVGLQGGVPFAVSTFSSFGADKPRAGYDFGLYGGYRFGPVLSLEAQAAWGKALLSARACCVGSGYWLGADGNCYLAPVAGMDGYDYADLKSSVQLQSYGLQLNVNLLGFFSATRHSRWALHLSPRLAAMGTKATLRTLGTDERIATGVTRWHLGAGGRIAVACALTRSLSVGLYSGLTALTGKPVDAVPRHRHSSNFIWESGLRIGWTFGRSGKPARSEATPPSSAIRTECPDKQEPIGEARALPPERPDTLPHSPVDTATVQIAAEVPTDTVVTFPTIYFPFNATAVTRAELPKVEQIAALLRTHPTMKITLTGWCDTRGSRAVNARISRRRAEAVKRLLVARGIAAGRIQAVGRGIDYQTLPPRKARRVEAATQGKEGPQ